jgi:uncharacterized protein (DUF2141 family)
LQEKNAMKIKVLGLRSGNGQIAVSVFAKEGAEGFPEDRTVAVAQKIVPLQGKKEIVIETQTLPEGSYAIALIHDEDSDSKFKINIGVSKEGFGFSNNPPIRFGPPSIEKCFVQMNTEDTEVPVLMKYF